MKKYVIIASVLLLTGCFTYYPKYPKPVTSCEQLVAPTDTIKKLLTIMASKRSFNGSKDVKSNDSSFLYKNWNVKYSDINYIRFGAKRYLIGRKYSLILIRKEDKKQYIFFTYNKNLAMYSLCSFQCLCGIDLETNKKPKTGKGDNYDKLKKLNELYKSGALTKGEYESQKYIILQEIKK